MTSALASFREDGAKQPHGERRRPVALLIGLLVYAAVVQFAYASVISPTFGYLKYFYVSPDWVLMGLAFFLAYLSGLQLKPSMRRPSDVALWALYVLVVIPVALVPFYGGIVTGEQAILLSAGLSLTFVLCTAAVRHIRPFSIPRPSSGRSYLWLFVAGWSLLTYLAVTLAFGLDFQLYGLTEVGDARLDYKETVQTGVPLVGYLILNQGNVINPFLLTVASRARNLPLLAAALLGQLFLYSAGGHKTVVLSIPVCIAIGLLSRRSNKFTGTAFVAACGGAAIAAVAIDSMRHMDLVQVFINRMLVTGGYLTPMYYDVFSSFEKVRWSHSFLAEFVTSPYGGEAPGNIVGRIYMGRPDINANANFFADGYANFGIIGVLVSSALLVGLLILLDASARGLPPHVIVGTMALPAFTLANVTPVNGLTSYGAVAIILFALATREREAVTPSRHPVESPEPDPSFPRR